MYTLPFYLPFLLLFVAGAVYVERKIAAFIQGRVGPRKVGPRGILQSVADLSKLLQKELITPQNADQKLFRWAPAFTFIALFSGFAMMPVHSQWGGAPTEAGMVYVLAALTMAWVGGVASGWFSGNQYAHMGAARLLTQCVASEVPASLSVFCVAISSHTANLQEISRQQGSNWHNCSAWSEGLLTWNVCATPPLALAYIVFFVASMALCHRAPFDLPESESELVGGYQTEYGGLRWGWLMLSEYGAMLLMALLGVVLFLGGWHSPLPLFQLHHVHRLKPFCEAGWLLFKAMCVIWVQMWIRWTFPRVRFDQLIKLCWGFLTPMALAACLWTVLWEWMRLCH